MVRSSPIKKRIERLFAESSYRQRGTRWIAALALLLFAPLVYLTAAARLDTPQEAETSQAATIPWDRLARVTALSPENVAALETDLQANPEDLNLRLELVVYYDSTAQDLPFTAHLLWFIENHPGFPGLQVAQGLYRRGPVNSEAARAPIAAAWEQAITEHAGSPQVFLNAADYLERSDPERALEILQKGEQLDGANRAEFERGLTVIFAAAEMAGANSHGTLNGIAMNEETASRLRAQLAASGDPALLASVGRTLVVMTPPPPNGEQQNQRGLELIRQAIKLDPGNARWTEALQAAQAEPRRKANYAQMMEAAAPRPGVVRIGEAAAESGMVHKVDPVYPPLALNARVQGSVEFTVTVAASGKVENLRLVRGHPLLVNAAKDAVLQWVYHQASQEGQPISFETEAIVPFKLDQ